MRIYSTLSPNPRKINSKKKNGEKKKKKGALKAASLVHTLRRKELNTLRCGVRWECGKVGQLLAHTSDPSCESRRGERNQGLTATGHTPSLCPLQPL